MTIREALGSGDPMPVILRALHTNDALYVLAKWPDTTRSDMRDPYIWNDEKKEPSLNCMELFNKFGEYLEREAVRFRDQYQFEPQLRAGIDRGVLETTEIPGVESTHFVREGTPLTLALHLESMVPSPVAIMSDAFRKELDEKGVSYTTRDWKLGDRSGACLVVETLES